MQSRLWERVRCIGWSSWAGESPSPMPWSSGSRPAAIKAGAVSKKFVARPNMRDKADPAWMGDVMVAVGTVASIPSTTAEATFARFLPLAPRFGKMLPTGARRSNAA